MTRIEWLIVIALLILAIGICMVIVQRACGAEIDVVNWARVYIECPNQVSEDTEFNVQVMIEDVWDLAGFSMEMEFDRDVIKAKKVSEGTFLGSSTFWVKPDISNTQGTITEIVCVNTAKTAFHGDGLLFSVKLEGRDVGFTEIRLGNVQLCDDDANSIAVTVDSADVYVVEFADWDVNQDGVTDLYDLVTVAQALGSTIYGKPFPNPDVNGDKIVTIEDLVKVAKHFGESTTGLAPSKRGVPARFRPVLSKVRDLLLSDPERDAQTYRLVKELLHQSGQVKLMTWGKVRW